MRVALSLTLIGLASGPAYAQSLLATSAFDTDHAEHDPFPTAEFATPSSFNDAVANAPLAPLSQTFQLSSRSTATKTIYLDFDGHTTTDPGWEGGRTLVTPAFDPGDNGAAFTDAELERIQYIWQRVSEDFSPFNVNVTTQAPPLSDLMNGGGSDTRWGIRVAIGDSWGLVAGGVALLNTFTSSRDTPTFVFENHLGNGNEKFVAEAISHEVGHTLGLSHDGRTSPAEGYYGGHGSGETGWAPIMGVGYSQNLSQWSKGEYANSDQKQDDLSIITTRNGFGYRADDHGNAITSATALEVSDGTNISGAGVISTNTDVDVFSFVHGGGLVNLVADPFDRGPNLDILMQLLDAAGNLLASSNPFNDLSVQMVYNLLPGEYFVRVDGVGKGDPLTTGYSDYGSLGQFFISGTIGALPVPEPASVTLLALTLSTLIRRPQRAVK